jgi:pimeloyl-ACP methyl ester carboxylesterase
MIRKCSYIWAILSLFIIVTLAHAGRDPLSPMDAKYPYAVKSVAVNGNKVAYIDEGKGQTIVFIHGVSTTLASFDVLFPVFIKKGYRVIAIDLLGYGKSDKPDITYSVPFHAETVIALIKQLGLKDAVMVGHSMGGAISLYAMLKEPDLFRSMVLLTPGGLNEYTASTVFYFKSSYNYVYGNRFSDLKTARKYYHETVYAWNPAMDEFLKTRERMMIHPEWIKVQKTIKDSSLSTMLIAKEILPKIGAIKQPVLVLLAANDSLVPTKIVKDNIEKRTKEWKIEVFNQCGHMIQYDQKEKVIQQMLEFLSK